MPHKVDFIVPVYNEKDNFKALYEHLQRLVRSDWRMYVVYDFPEDSTLEVARPLAQSDPRIHLVQNKSTGVAPAIVTGFGVAQSEAVMVVMCDEDPEAIQIFDAMIERFYETNAGVVAASRYMKGGHAYGAPLIKSMLSRLAGVSLYYVIGLPTHDATNATRLYKKSFLNGVVIESQKGFVQTLELTLKAYLAGERIEELPVTWREREVGKSRFSVRKWLPAYLHWYFYGLKHYYLPFLYSDSKKNK